jgi:hypothetical protein
LIKNEHSKHVHIVSSNFHFFIRDISFIARDIGYNNSKTQNWNI